ncbi:MAG: basic amino acid ABC transporter substrate-binding protein [Nitriliruptoraceae bacterium]
MRITTRITAVLAVLSLLVVACGGDDDASTGDFDLVSAGTLTVCTDVPYPPFEFEDPDSPIGYRGFDIDLIAAIAEENGLEVEIIATGFEGLESGTTMAAGTCDLAASAMTITDARAERLDFSDAYYSADQSLLVLEGSEVAGIDDLVEGLTVGVQSGTTGEQYAEENVPGATVTAFENPGDLFTALQAGQLDAVLQDLPVNEEYAANTGDVQVIAEFVTDENYGFAMTRDREDGLVDAVNTGLQAVRDSGLYDELFAEYFLAG